MKCRKVKRSIVNYADLDGSQRKRLDEHFKTCPGCLSEFQLYQRTVTLVKEVTNFEEPEDFWQDYRVDVGRKIPYPPLWQKLLVKFEDLSSLIKTPLFGPIPAYVFSAVLLLFLAIGLYPAFSSSKYSEGFENNLVVYEGELLSAIDDGGVTIYTVGNR
ncbi:MAG: anti-sigma factor family protein [Candidatus Zixiibacteriota bacterium]